MKNNPLKRPSLPMLKKQSGVVLIISLIILLVLTIVVVSGNQSVVLQEKMTSAVRDSHVSLALAEAGVVAAEAQVDALSDITAFVSGGGGGLYSLGNGPADLYDTAIWVAARTNSITVDLPDGTGQAEVLFFIEHLGSLNPDAGASPDLEIRNNNEKIESVPRDLFKIVSRATGSTGFAERVVVTHFATTLL